MRQLPFPNIMVFSLVLPAVVASQDMSVVDYTPRSTLVVPAHPRRADRYPSIDVHAHQNGAMPRGELDARACAGFSSPTRP